LQGPISKKPITKIGLVEWLKVKTLSSSPSTAKKKKKKRKDKKKERKRQKDCVKAL
jgi:ribosomal protein S21